MRRLVKPGSVGSQFDEDATLWWVHDDDPGTVGGPVVRPVFLVEQKDGSFKVQDATFQDTDTP